MDLEIEKLACSVPGVRQVAAIAAYHPKWEERPLLIIVADQDHLPTRQYVLEQLRPRLRDDVVIVDSLLMTATGKISKLAVDPFTAKTYSDVSPLMPRSWCDCVTSRRRGVRGDHR